MRDDREAAFVDFVRGASPRLLKTAWFLCGDPLQAEELVQSALERVYLRWGHLHGTTPLAYTRKVLLHLHIDHQRRSVREVPLEAVLDRTTVDAGPEDTDQLVGLLRRLPLRERQVVVMRHYVGATEAETAEALDVSLGTVKSSASRGLAKLRALYASEESSHAR